MATLIIDKNVLQGLSPDAWTRLAAEHTVVMTDVLFFECLKASADERAACFGKLPAIDNPIPLLQHVGHHLQFEFAHGRPLGRPSDHRVPWDYRFNATLSLRDAPMSADVEANIEHHLRAVRNRLPDYIERIRDVHDRMDRARTATGLSRPKIADQLRAEARDLSVVREFLRGFRDPEGQRYLPPVEAMGADSAIVVHFQTHYAMALQRALDHGAEVVSDDFAARHGDALVHDLFDLDYLVLGVLEGGLATHEKRLRRLFVWLRPEGTLWPPPETPSVTSLSEERGAITGSAPS